MDPHSLLGSCWGCTKRVLSCLCAVIPWGMGKRQQCPERYANQKDAVEPCSRCMVMRGTVEYSDRTVESGNKGISTNFPQGKNSGKTWIFDFYTTITAMPPECANRARTDNV